MDRIDSWDSRAGRAGIHTQVGGRDRRRLLSVASSVLLSAGLLAIGWAGPLAGPVAAINAPSGKVVAWGLDTSHQTDVPAAAQSGVVAISAGGEFAVALKTDGTVVAWGDDSRGQTDVPAGLSNVTQISAGCSHTLALKSDGTIVAWGYNYQGDTQVPLPGDGARYTAVAAGCDHSLALYSTPTASGLIMAWGSDSQGQIDVPVIHVGYVTLPLTNIKAIAAGDEFSLALNSAGTVDAWGDDNLGQTNVPADLQTKVRAITAG